MSYVVYVDYSSLIPSFQFKRDYPTEDFQGTQKSKLNLINMFPNFKGQSNLLFVRRAPGREKDLPHWSNQNHICLRAWEYEICSPNNNGFFGFFTARKFAGLLYVCYYHHSVYTFHWWAQIPSQCKRTMTVVQTRAQRGLKTSQYNASQACAGYYTNFSFCRKTHVIFICNFAHEYEKT